MTGSVSFRIRRVWFDAIVAGTKTVEVRKHSDYWADVKARGPSVAVFVCGKDVHRRRITAITPYPTAAAALGRPPSAQGVKDIGTGAVLGFHLGEVC